MRKKLFLLLILIAVMAVFTGCGETMPTVSGSKDIFDEARLFSDDDRKEIFEAMDRVSQFGTVGGYTTYSSGGSTASKASKFYDRYYGSESGVLFVIDMDERVIYIESDGYIGSFITRGKARTITDNVYKYASHEDYKTCSVEALSQVLDIMEGRRISERMGLISSIIIALMLGTLANFLLLRRINKKKEVSALEWETSNHGRVTFSGAHVEKKSRLIMAGGTGGSSRGRFHHRSGGGFRGGGFGGGHHSHGGGHRF